LASIDVKSYVYFDTAAAAAVASEAFKGSPCRVLEC